MNLTRWLIATWCAAIVFWIAPAAVMAGPVRFFAGTGSSYEVVEIKLTWTEARAAAETKVHEGISGRLATITSDAENNFIVDKVLPNISNGDSYWLGGFQPVGSPEPAGGWRWITPEPFTYAKWRTSPAEPSDLGNEDRIEIFNRLQDGTWNDLADDNSSLSEGYVVEYARRATGIPLPPALPAMLGVMPLVAVYHRIRRGAFLHLLRQLRVIQRQLYFS